MDLVAQLPKWCAWGGDLVDVQENNVFFLNSKIKFDGFPIYWRREKKKFEGGKKEEIQAGPDVSEARGVLAWGKRQVAVGKRSLIN